MADEKVALVSLSIDGQTVTVPKGTNLIEAAKSVGIEIPFYCYHRHLSVAGNCRMCQVEIEGMPKLTIACNTEVREGMEVRTHRTSQVVADAQRATLEFLLINHPLDCTVCDQAGHCKLQDFYYQYNSKPSRFVEEKVEKVKAEPLGPEVIYDGERCILCTRCVRFCSEVTKTSELGVFNRGDSSLIGVESGVELSNPLAGSVVDLCPVGALTHRRWRFNTRIWNTEEIDSVCPGCSTGCNAKVSVRDGEVVLVKARLNSEVNQEWMCDEGRYGFGRFQPSLRLGSPLVRDEHYLMQVSLEEALEEAAKLMGSEEENAAVFLSPFLTLEECWVSLAFANRVMGVGESSDSIAVQMALRDLSEIEQILLSPDFAPNAQALLLLRGARQSSEWREELEKQYRGLLDKLRGGSVKRLLLLGDQAIRAEDLDPDLIEAILGVETSVALCAEGVLDGEGASSEETALGAHQLCRVLLPSTTVNEKNGIFVNRDFRMQRLRALLPSPSGSAPEWQLLCQIAKACKKSLVSDEISDDRSLFREMVKRSDVFRGLTLSEIGSLGLNFAQWCEQKTDGCEQKTDAQT